MTGRPARQVAGQLAAFGPHAGAHRVAGRAGVSVLVPLLVLWLVDRQAWSIYATFGAFASLYGRQDVGWPRARMQATLAALLTVSVAGGVAVGLSAERSWLAVPVTAGVAVVGSVASDALGWHPPGPLFLVFAVAACASVPSVPTDLPVATLVAGSAAAFAVLVGSAGAAWRGLRGRGPGPADDSGLRWRRGGGLSVARSGVAVLAAGALATGAGIGHRYWAMVSAVVPLVARDFGHQLVRGLHRVLGTFVGLGVAWLVLAVDLRGLALIVLVAALQVLAELLVGRNYALALVAITPLALLMVHLAVAVRVSSLVVDRGLETLVGVLIGVVVGFLTRRRPVGTHPSTPPPPPPPGGPPPSA